VKELHDGSWCSESRIKGAVKATRAISVRAS
jgi:hypothetical protein